jgi:hypothetical protein
MSNAGEMITLPTMDRGMLPVADVVARVRRIQEVMQSVMIGPDAKTGKDGIHYGIIPGTPKPTLYQPGAELLCTTFRIAPVPRVEDLSAPDSVRYRVVMQAVNQVTGESLGEGVGECSSDETKYRWCRPVCDEEWDETPVDQRREKWFRGKNNSTFKAKQIRTSPADIANTVLKMAYKRALISMTRVALACSDIFAQDLEDLPAEVLESVVGVETDAKPASPAPQRKSAATTPAASAPGAVTIAGVEVFKGTGKNGKAYEKFTITLSDGRKASTFDAKVRDLAVTLADTHAAVDVVIEDKGGYPTLTELSVIHADADA